MFFPRLFARTRVICADWVFKLSVSATFGSRVVCETFLTKRLSSATYNPVESATDSWTYSTDEAGENDCFRSWCGQRFVSSGWLNLVLTSSTGIQYVGRFSFENDENAGNSISFTCTVVSEVDTYLACPYEDASFNGYLPLPTLAWDEESDETYTIDITVEGDV